MASSDAESDAPPPPPHAAPELGFVDHVPPDDPLLPHHLPSKVGARPIWLNPAAPLDRDAHRLVCGVCALPLVFLLQLYAPESSPPDAYHRSLYVFCCKTGACHALDASACWRVLRTQLPCDNPFYTRDANDDLVYAPPPSLPALCVVCGLRGTKTCGQCHRVHYCSRHHQKAHWTLGQHKADCASSAPSNPTALPSLPRLLARKALFPEWDIVTETEALEDTTPQEGAVELMSRMNINPSEPQAEDYEPAESYVDQAFLAFQARIAVHPDQVLRYARVSDALTSPQPLWAADANRPDHVPDCERCGAPRTFEFQILPQLLTHLALDDTDPHALDWGTVLVYSCSASCSLPPGAWADEWVWRQAFSHNGLGDRFQTAT